MFKKCALIGTLCLAALIPAYLFGNSIWIWSTGDRLEKKLAAIRDAGDPVTLPDLARPESPPEKNAAVRLRRAGKDLEAMVKEMNAILNGDDYQAGKLTEEDRKKLKSLFEANPSVLKLVEEAGDCSTYDPQLDYTAAPEKVLGAALGDGVDFRGVINLLGTRSRLQVAERQRHEALQTCLLLLRLARLYDGNLFIVNGLVTCAARTGAVEAANRVLRTGPVTDEDRDALEAELARHDSHDGFIKVLKKERAFGVSSFASMKNWLNHAFFDNDECYYLDLVQEQIDLAPKPYAEFVAATNNFKANMGRSTPLAVLYFPAAHKMREAHERVRGVVRCLRVFNALQRAGVKPEDGEPKLKDLKLPAEATTDPFTAKPLCVKIVDGQFVIYTVGPDRKDDGGDLAGGKDFGVGPVPAAPK
jgi:hypothetical protein